MKLFYLLIILCFLSCKKKDGNFTLTGTITDDSFGVGLSDSSISLYQVSGSNSNQILISTISTDVNGNYKFVFKREMMEKYILKITKTNYYDFDETIYFSSLSLENDNVRNYSTTAKSWVRLKFLNLAPVNSDELDFTKQIGKSSGLGCAPLTEQHLIGAIDTSIVYINDGNKTFSYNYSVFGTSIMGNKSVVTVPFDTTEIYLEY